MSPELFILCAGSQWSSWRGQTFGRGLCGGSEPLGEPEVWERALLQFTNSKRKNISSHDTEPHRNTSHHSTLYKIKPNNKKPQHTPDCINTSLNPTTPHQTIGVVVNHHSTPHYTTQHNTPHYTTQQKTQHNTPHCTHHTTHTTLPTPHYIHHTTHTTLQ